MLAGSSAARLETLWQFGLGNDNDALLGDHEAALAIMVEVVADGRILRNLHVLVDNRAANAAMATHVNALEQNGRLHQGKAIDAHVRRQNAPAHVAAADDGAL